MRFSTVVVASVVSVTLGNATFTSLTGRCGGLLQLTCNGSKFGDCCGSSGWCGSTESHCGKGCDPKFGTCPPPLPPSPPISKNGLCGKNGKGQTCLGSPWGNCCSGLSLCGRTILSCGLGCQPGFGDCNGKPSSPPPASPTTSSSSSQSSSISVSETLSTTSTSLTTTTTSTESSTTTTTAVSSSESSTEVSSSSTESSTTSSSSTVSPTESTPECTHYTNKNLIRDPSFDRGDLSEWNAIHDEQSDAGIGFGNGKTGNTEFKWVTTGTAMSRLVLQQYDVYIPSGFQVECDFWSRVLTQELADTEVRMFIDGQQCAFNFHYGDDTAWSSGLAGMSAQVSGNYHTVEILVHTWPNGGTVEFGLDDIWIQSMEEPGDSCD